MNNIKTPEILEYEYLENLGYQDACHYLMGNYKDEIEETEDFFIFSKIVQ